MSLVDVTKDPFLIQQNEVEQEILEEERKHANLVVEVKGHLPSTPLWVQSCGFARYLQRYSKAELMSLSKKPSGDNDVDTPIGKVLQVVEELLDETWMWYLDRPGCRLTRPIVVVLSQFWTMANVHSKGFRPGIEYATKSKYIH